MEYLLVATFAYFIGSFCYIVFDMCRFTSAHHKKK